MAVVPLTWMPAAAHGSAFKDARPLGVAVHSTESDNTSASAENIAGPGWFGGPVAGTSAHKIVDLNTICEGVKRTIVAYHAGPTGNSYYIAYEFCGRASWSAAKWREPAQLTMLRIAAPHIADDLRFCGAPARWLSVVQVAQLQKGMLTHNDIRLAFPGTTTHSDPGPNFPYAELLAMVAAELAPTPAPASDEDDDMPQIISESLLPGEGKVINIAPSGGMKDGKFVVGGAAGWGQGWLSLLGDCLESPRVPIKARVGILGSDGNYRPAVGKDFVLSLTPGKELVIMLAPGDSALVATAYDYPFGVAVEYAKA